MLSRAPTIFDCTRPKSSRKLGLLGIVLGGILALGVTAPSQAQNYPRSRLDTVTPPGGKAGTTVEVVLTGADLQEVNGLYFSDDRIKAEKVQPPPPDPKVKNPPPFPLKFKVNIPGDVAVGIYDVRAIGKWGITNPRAFAVGDLTEVMEKEPNNDVGQAQKVELNTTVNGVISAGTDVDYYTFAGKKGQRIVIYCDASGIDSRLNPLVELFSSKGKRLGSSRNYFDRNALVDYTVNEDDEFLVRLTDFAYQTGGPAYFYRLSITTAPWIDAVYPPAIEKGKPATVTLFGRNLPGGKLDPALKWEGRALEKAQAQVNAPAPGKGGIFDYKGLLLPASVTVEGFEFRTKNDAGVSNPALISFTDLPLVLSDGKNAAAEQAQKVTLPVTLCGVIDNPAGQNWYAFSAKKGEVFSFECFCDRLGGPSGFILQLRKVDAKENNPVIATFNSHPELPPPNTGFSIGNDPEDPKGKYTFPADGDYQLLVTTETAQMVTGPRYVYRVDINKERPDFRLMLVENENDTAGSFTLHKGGAQEISVYLVRQDGFDGEVLLEAEGLPGGVTCVPQVVGPKIRKGALVFQAADSAPDYSGPIKIKGTAVIDGKPVVRPAQAACLVWPAPAQNQIPAISRLTRSVCLAVRDKGPYALDVDTKPLSVPVGGNVELKITRKASLPDFKAKIDLVRVSSPVLTNGQPVGIPAVGIDPAKNDVVVKFAVPGNAQPGTYSLVFQGKAKYNMTDPNDMKKKRNADVYESTPPVKIVVYDKIADVAVANPNLTVKAGETVEVLVKVQRLHDFQGEYEVSMAVPGGIGGVSADKVKVPAGASEAKLLIKTAKNATVTANPNFAVNVTGKVGNLTFSKQAKFQLTITKAAASLPPANVAPVAVARELLPADTKVVALTIAP